jgi:hypothetical protein
MDTFDLETQKQLEEFHRSLSEQARFYQQAALYMTARRLLQDEYAWESTLRVQPGPLPRMWHWLTRPAAWGGEKAFLGRKRGTRKPRIKIITPK